jgi:N6-L-threonylcarbamoyladenine synthase
VKPDVAQAAHAAAIESTVDGVLADAGLGPGQLSAVAVTIGPGLSLCLQVRVVGGVLSEGGLCGG